MEQSPSEIIFGIVMPVIVISITAFVFWILPVWLGIRWARQKGYSPLWMLFGISPVGGWIAAAILQYLPPRIRCAQCGRFVQRDFSACPWCRSNLHSPMEEVTEFLP